MRTTAYNDYATNGNTALQSARKPHFVVIDGGLANQDYRQERSHEPRPVRVREVVAAQPFVPSLVQRLAVIAAAAAVIAVLAVTSLFMANAHGASVASAYAGAELQEVVVHSGDTLWGIAEEHAVEGVDTAELVELIRSENALESANLSVGQHLMVPVAQL